MKCFHKKTLLSNVLRNWVDVYFEGTVFGTRVQPVDGS
jgi:hypothetical protein